MTNQGKPARLTFVLTALALGCAAWMAGIAVLPRSGEPGVTWRFGSDEAAVGSFETVPAWDSMTLSVSLPFDAYVYVVSFDHLHGTVTYFPTEYLGTDLHDPTTGRMNFLAAGEHTLPGSWNGSVSTWFVPDLPESLSLCVIASRKPLTDLEAILPLTMQVGNRAYRDRSMGFYMPRAGRAQVIGKTRLPHPLLQAALDSATAPLAGPMLAWPERPGVYFDTLHIVPRKPRPGVVAPSNPFARQLAEQVENKRRGK
ncbi:MAG: hypothetical protein VX951_01260 [Planctomycetota bacterium]|nr:hypothetical protein [Planctomycetota bacterium]